MNSQVSQLFSSFKCSSHNDAGIAQVCVSSMCPETNRLCCLQCVDENHMGHQHTLISCKKLNNLLFEFHTAAQQRQTLNMKLLSNVKIQQDQSHSLLNRYFHIISQNLAKQNSLALQQQLNKLSLKAQNQQELKAKANEILDNNAWILELNSKSKNVEQQKRNETSSSNMKLKYQKLQTKLKQINGTCLSQLKQVIEKRQIQLKKLFHLFEQVKYNIEDEGSCLQNVLSANKQFEKNQQIATPQVSPHKQSYNSQVQNKKLKSVFGFLGSLVGGSNQ